MPMKHLLLGTILSAGLMAASAGLTFLMFMFLARVLGAVEFGLFASMFALGMIGAVAALFGQQTLSMKILSALGDDPDGATERRRALRQSYRVALIGAAIVVTLLLSGGIIAAWFGADIDMRYLLGACALVLPFALSDLVAHQYRAFGAIFLALAPRDILWRGLVVLICLGAVSLPFAFTDALTAMILLSVMLMAIVTVQLIGMIVSNRDRLAIRSDAADTGPMQWRVSAWMWLASLGTMGANLNIASAALFLPADQIGAYFAAQKISQLLQLPIIAINISATPVFARLYNQNDMEGLRNVARKIAMLIAVPLALGAAIIGVFAPQLLALFDPTFASAALALILLAGSHLLVGLGGPTRQLMLMSNGERQVVRLTLISEIAGLALIPILVPMFGIVGAALAACAARVLFTAMSVFWCRMQLGVDTSLLSLVTSQK